MSACSNTMFKHMSVCSNTLKQRVQTFACVFKHRVHNFSCSFIRVFVHSGVFKHYVRSHGSVQTPCSFDKVFVHSRSVQTARMNILCSFTQGVFKHNLLCSNTARLVCKHNLLCSNTCSNTPAAMNIDVHKPVFKQRE